jgi:RNA polymerase sigma-70 factor (ECF subfamily)
MAKAAASPEPGDEALVARAVAGDSAAFEALVARHERRAYSLAYRLVGTRSDAQDVVQDAFLRAYRALPSFRGGASFSTWLYRIVTNTALMLLRSRRRRPTQPLDAFLPRFDAAGRHAGTPAQLARPAQAEELLDRKALARKVRAGIARLPERQRTAFVLRDLEELGTAEVAQVLGISEAAVRQRVHRARLLLRGYLGEVVRASR